MATTVRELRIQARKLGATNVREMTQDELEEYIAENTNGKNGRKGKKVARKAALKAVKKAGKRGPGRPRKVDIEDEDEEDEEEVAPRRRGRPKGSKNKTAAKRGRPAKKSATAKASTKKSRRSGGPGRPVGSGTGTRVLLSEKINWNRDFDFREGTTQDYILQQIRKVAAKTKETSEIREKVFDRLVDKIGERDELTFLNRSTGKPWKGADAEQRLKYYISRTMFDYAVNTDQHEGSGESVASVPRGGASTKVKKTATKKRGRPRKVVEEDYDDDEDEEPAPRRRGRPKGSKNKKRGPGRPPKAETAKRGPGRPKGSGKKRGPGRPKGSKNKR